MSKSATPSCGMSEPISDALNDALSGWRYIRKHHGDLSGVAWDRVEEKLKAALAALNSVETPRSSAVSPSAVLG